ncbi:hypothetical protein NC796_21865 [Aliifodinibius sp. S!AR15-10]|uniref:hypothetical protein n=1 Tax=Aliifodinibius sp. S!AR15-10 TaxID=2950437 RepID=UPI002861CD33|nr:hypothetical protein [Aliifodinibius sp. S!AR15-10]MDR8393815.1 hypothetical protein [Aliifodinibius sp. S!AR15-10]
MLGLTILLTTIKPWETTTGGKKYLGHLDRENHEIKSQSLLNLTELRSEADILLLFVVADEFCSTCISEIHGYVDEIKKFANSPLNKYKIQTHGIILSNNLDGYNRAKYLMDFPFSTSFVKWNSNLAKILKSWRKSVTGINQIVLLDPKQSIVTARIGIFSSGTKLYFKKNVIQEAFFEVENH